MIARLLGLDRPLAFLDTETTGTSTAEDRIVELALVIIYPDTEAGPGETYRKVRRLNPERPIPTEATAVHGIRDEDVAASPAFRQVAQSLWELLNPCDIAGFNARRFDLPILRAEFRRAGFSFEMQGRRLIDLQYLFHLRERRDLGAAVRFYLDEDHGEAHTAEADTEVLPRLLAAQLERYPDLPANLDGLHAACDEFAPFQTEVEAWFGDDLDAPVFQRGKKHKGHALADVLLDDPGYIHWMLEKAEDMDEEVKDFLRRFRKDLPAPAGRL